MTMIRNKGEKLVTLPSGDAIDPLSIRGIQARRTSADNPRIIEGIEYKGFVKIETATNTYYVQCLTAKEAESLRDELKELTNSRHAAMVPKRYKQGPGYRDEEEDEIDTSPI